MQRPLELGADICMYSAAKYMNGHSDVILGAASTNNNDIIKQLRQMQVQLKLVSNTFVACVCVGGG